MDVRPAPVTRVGVAAGARGRLAALAPLLVLAMVAGAAWAGAAWPRTQPGAPGPSLPGLPGRGAVTPRLIGFPSSAFGLPVESIETIREGRASGETERGLVAVAGILRNDALPLTCPAIRYSLAKDFCRRLLALFAPTGAAANDAVPGSPSATRAEAFLGILLPGTAAPPILGTEADLAHQSTASAKVVLIGHFDDVRATCGAERDACPDDFLVERIAWADGMWLDPPIVRDQAFPEASVPSSGERTQQILDRAAARGEQVLGIAILGIRLLAIVDSQAAAIVGAGRSGGLWYVRSIPRPGTNPPVVWAVVDDATGQVLGYTWPQP